MFYLTVQVNVIFCASTFFDMSLVIMGILYNEMKGSLSKSHPVTLQWEYHLYWETRCPLTPVYYFGSPSKPSNHKCSTDTPELALYSPELLNTTGVLLACPICTNSFKNKIVILFFAGEYPLKPTSLPTTLLISYSKLHFNMVIYIWA